MRVVATWSGGIDSTGVVASCLKMGWPVTAISLTLPYGPLFNDRERQARMKLLPHLKEIGTPIDVYEESGSWLKYFSPDGVDVPLRNKRIIDYLVERWCRAQGIRNIGMGEYIGCDTWVVQDHVGASDCDHRALTAYLYNEYGLEWRLISLQDFGESRYKHDRLKIGVSVLGPEVMALTTNCLYDKPIHCGRCYKCIERAAAFDMLNSEDITQYENDPRRGENYGVYVTQMKGAPAHAPFAQFTP